MFKISFPYSEILDKDIGSEQDVWLVDHLGGFDEKYYNPVLHKLNQFSKDTRVIWHEILDPAIKHLYSDIHIQFDVDLKHLHFNHFPSYQQHPFQTFQTFLCSFNGSPHVSRKLLVSILEKFGWFNPETCSKNFSYTVDILDGHLKDFLDNDQHYIYRKFFVDSHSQIFFDKIYSFGHIRYNHKNNIYNLENKLTSSFLHLVSETLATSFHPFVTEKFLYSVVTRGLFLAYAQPRWHDHLERYYGFRRYDRIFDYRFDEIQNPIERLVELLSMISKFSVLSSDDWRDLYEMEAETIEYNYDWYFSGRYLEKLRGFQ